MSAAIFRLREKSHASQGPCHCNFQARRERFGPPGHLPAGKRGRWISRAVISLLAGKARPRRLFEAPRAAGAALPCPSGWAARRIARGKRRASSRLAAACRKTGTARLHRAFGDRKSVFRPVPRAALAVFAAPTRAARRASIRGAVSRSLAARYRPYMRAGISAKPHCRSQPPQNSRSTCRRPLVRAALPDLAEISGLCRIAAGPNRCLFGAIKCRRAALHEPWDAKSSGDRQSQI